MPEEARQMLKGNAGKVARKRRARHQRKATRQGWLRRQDKAIQGTFAGQVISSERCRESRKGVRAIHCKNGQVGRATLGTAAGEVAGERQGM
jgi:hypothetical protein